MSPLAVPQGFLPVREHPAGAEFEPRIEEKSVGFGRQNALSRKVTFRPVDLPSPILKATYFWPTLPPTGREVRLMERLSKLAAMNDGWFGRGSRAPQRGVVAAVALALPKIAALGVHVDLVAQPDGSLSFERMMGSQHLVAIIEDEGRRMYLHTSDDDAEDDLEGVGLSAAFRLQQLMQFLLTGHVR